MKFKNLMILGIILIALISVGCVSASNHIDDEMGVNDSELYQEDNVD